MAILLSRRALAIQRGIPIRELGPAMGSFPPGLVNDLPLPPVSPQQRPARSRREAEEREGAREADQLRAERQPRAGGGAFAGSFLERIFVEVGNLLTRGAAGPLGPIVGRPFRPTPAAPAPGTPGPALGIPDQGGRSIDVTDPRAAAEFARKEIIGGSTAEARERARRELLERERERFAGERDIIDAGPQETVRDEGYTAGGGLTAL